MTGASNSRARGIDRVIDILEHLRSVRRPMSIGDLARDLKAPRSTIYEIVRRLQEVGILDEADNNTVYFGRSVYLYADAYLASQPVMRLGRDEVVKLSKHTGETTQLCMLVNNKYTVAFMNPGTSLFRISSEIGVLVPIPWTASGRLLLGRMNDAEIRALIPPDDFVLPDGRCIAVDSFIKEVHDASAENRMVTTGLSDPYTTCLASAVHDQNDQPVATICHMVPASTPQERKDELLDGLTRSAHSISSKLSSPMSLP